MSEESWRHYDRFLQSLADRELLKLQNLLAPGGRLFAAFTFEATLAGLVGIEWERRQREARQPKPLLDLVAAE